MFRNVTWFLFYIWLRKWKFWNVKHSSLVCTTNVVEVVRIAWVVKESENIFVTAVKITPVVGFSVVLIFVVIWTEVCPTKCFTWIQMNNELILSMLNHRNFKITVKSPNKCTWKKRKLCNRCLKKSVLKIGVRYDSRYLGKICWISCGLIFHRQSSCYISGWRICYA